MGLNSSVGTGRGSFGFNGNYNFTSMNVRLSASKANTKTTDFQSIHRQFSNGIEESIFTPYNFDGEVNKIASAVDFYIGKRHELSLSADYTDDSHSYFNQSRYFNVTGQEDYDYLRENAHFHYVTILNANYRFKFNKENHFLELDYNLNSSDNNYPIKDFLNDAMITNELLSEDFNLASMAADYTVPINDKVIFETGILRNTQTLESQQLDLAGAAGPNQFTYSETLLGGYIMSRFSMGKTKIQAGLRYENFRSHSRNKTTNFKAGNKSSTLFPSVHFSRAFDETKTLNFGYSKRVSRPNFHHVNALQIVNPLFIWEYNPNITPEFSDNFELGFRKNTETTSLSFTSSYRYIKNIILWTESSANEQQVFRYENAGTSNSLGFEATISRDWVEFWKTSLVTNYYFTKIDQRTLVTWNKTYSSTIQLKNTVNIAKKLTTDLTYSFRPKRQSLFNYVEPRSRVDWAIQTSFFKKRLSTSLRIVDIFNQNLFVRNSRTANLNQETIWDFQSQTSNFLINVNYRLVENKGHKRNRKFREYHETPID